jgi:hypothetical protein
MPTRQQVACLLRFCAPAIFVACCLVALLSTSIQPGSAQAVRTLYIPQGGTPANIANFVQPDAGCKWTGVGGQVFDVNGSPVSGVVIKISGPFGGQNLLRYAVSGSSQQFGAGGFDLYLSDAPINTKSLSAQLVDVSGLPLGPSILVPTSSACTANLAVINFRQVSMERALFFPIARK